MMNYPRVEPIVVFFALIAAGAGSYVQFRVTPMLQLSRNLGAVVSELSKNLSIYKEQYTTVPEGEGQLSILPQFQLSAAENLIARGTLDAVQDRDLFNKIHEVHDIVRQINSRLAAHEASLMKPRWKLTAKKELYEVIVNGRAMNRSAKIL